MDGHRLLRVASAVVCLAVSLAAASFALAADDFDEDPMANLSEEMAKLREKGKWAKSGDLSEQLEACNESLEEQAFLPWGDTAEYVLVPGGDMEQLSGWEVDKGVSVLGAGGDSVLHIPEGSEVVTAPMCISVNHPTLRFFAENPGGPQLRLEVYVLYEDLQGKIKKLKIGKLRGTEVWQPTKALLLHVNRLAEASETGLTVVAFKFKTKKVGGKDAEAGDEGYFAPRQVLASADEPGWLLDDLYVDPFRSR
jgi:hypothetical protein